MRTEDDVETFLLESGYAFERLDEGQWRVSDETNGVDNIIVFITGTVVTLQLRLVALPDSPSRALLRRLLELNASTVIHGAFGIENGHIVLIGALELDHLDRNELRAMIDSISLGAGENYEELKSLIG